MLRVTALIDISAMGESALKSHMKGAKHKENGGCKTCTTLFDFTISKFPKASTTCSQSELTVPTPPLPQPVEGSKVQSGSGSEKFFSKDDVLKSEILWALKMVTNHMSFNSSKDTSKLFTAMFPVSNIAKQFQCGERKSAYICVFGLSEYFLKLLKDSVKGLYVVMFDESLNKKPQEKQMDVYLRYWDDESNQV